MTKNEITDITKEPGTALCEILEMCDVADGLIEEGYLDEAVKYFAQIRQSCEEAWRPSYDFRHGKTDLELSGKGS